MLLLSRVGAGSNMYFYNELPTELLEANLMS